MYILYNYRQTMLYVVILANYFIGSLYNSIDNILGFDFDT